MAHLFVVLLPVLHKFCMLLRGHGWLDFPCECITQAAKSRENDSIAKLKPSTNQPLGFMPSLGYPCYKPLRQGLMWSCH